MCKHTNLILKISFPSNVGFKEDLAFIYFDISLDKWPRKDPPNIDVKKESLTFQQIDMDSYIGCYILHSHLYSKYSLL